MGRQIARPSWARSESQWGFNPHCGRSIGSALNETSNSSRRSLSQAVSTRWVQGPPSARCLWQDSPLSRVQPRLRRGGASASRFVGTIAWALERRSADRFNGQTLSLLRVVLLTTSPDLFEASSRRTTHGHVCNQCKDLAPLEIFDPRAFQGDQDVPQELCGFVLSLALIYNDYKNIMHGVHGLEAAKPEGEFKFTGLWGTWSRFLFERRVRLNLWVIGVGSGWSGVVCARN